VHNTEIKIAKERLKTEEQLRFFVILGTVVGLILALLIILNIRLKQKYIKESFEKEQLLNQHLSEELKAKTKKLVNSSLKTLKNQNAIQEIENLIAEISVLESEELGQKIQRVKSEIRNSKLTSMKLCVLLRMNYSSDEISDVLGVANSTLKTARYRIHKKMGLQKGVRLQDYLIRLA
jgi:DNA-binding CsgD family transcriptional regulator